MLVYIRHGHDEYADATYAHDNNLTDRGRKQSYRLAKKLLRRYGAPTKIYCSPFRRTKQTSKQMAKYLQQKGYSPRMSYDPLLSRYFSSSETPHIAPETEKYEVPLDEGHQRFKRRCKKIARQYHHYADEKEIVWVITHALVYKRICRYYDQECSSRVSFLSWFIVPSSKHDTHHSSHRQPTHADHRHPTHADRRQTNLHQANLPLSLWKRN